jgi:hypothetical protein
MHKLLDQARLANASLAHQKNYLAATAACLGEDAVQLGKLGLAPNELGREYTLVHPTLLALGHFAP